MATFKVGDFVIAKQGNPGSYSYTTDYAVHQVVRIRSGERIDVKILAILRGHSHGTSCGLSTWDVRPRDFELYDLTKHGNDVIKGAIPTEAMFELADGMYAEKVGDKFVTVTDKKLKSYGKTFKVKERFETGFVNIGEKRPIIIHKKKLAGIDAKAKVGDYIVVKHGSASVHRTGNIYKLKAISEDGNTFTYKHAFGPDKVSGDFNEPASFFLRLNVRSKLVTDSVSMDVIRAFVEYLKTGPRKFWMIAVHTDAGIFPAESADGLYAPRRKFYSETVAREALLSMAARHGRRFYLLESVETAVPDHEPERL